MQGVDQALKIGESLQVRVTLLQDSFFNLLALINNEPSHFIIHFFVVTLYRSQFVFELFKVLAELVDNFVLGLVLRFLDIIQTEAQLETSFI